MTITTKYDIGQKVYYPNKEFTDDGRGTTKPVVKELTIARIHASAWGFGKVSHRVSYETLEYGFIGECLLFPTEKEAWEEHERRERANDEAMK